MWSTSELVSSVVISSNGEARRVCYLQATHRDIHRSQLLQAPRGDTCCKGGRMGEKERYICDLNQLLFYNLLINCQEVRNENNIYY